MKSQNKKTTRLDRIAGKTLRRYREAAGLSQQELGGKIGVTFQQVQKYENGKNRLSLGRFLSFARALKIRPEDLVTEIRGRL